MNTTDESVHARYAPHDSPRWTRCAGAVPYTEQQLFVRSESSRAADEGKASHLLLSTCITHNHRAHEYIGDTFCGIVVTVEMAEAVQVALDWIATIPGKVFSEVPVDPTAAIHAPDCEGTADIAIDGDKWATIGDYKHGVYHYYPVDGPQTLLYMLGFAVRENYRWEHYRIAIVQPRYRDPDVPAVRTWELTREELLKEARRLAEARHQCRKAEKNPTAYLTPGETQCRWCPAAGACPALANYAQQQALEEFGPVDPAEYDLERLAQALSAAELVRIWLKAVNAHALNVMELGNQVPGYKLVRGVRHRVWLDDDLVQQVAEELRVPVDQLMTQVPLSPAKVEALRPEHLTPGRIREVVSRYAHQPRGGLTIAKAADRRPAATPWSEN